MYTHLCIITHNISAAANYYIVNAVQLQAYQKQLFPWYITLLSPYSWYTPNTVFIMHRWNVSRKIDCHPLLISIVKAKPVFRFRKSFTLCLFSSFLLFRILEAFVLHSFFCQEKKKQKLDLRGYLAILWPFKKMIRGRRYQNTALRHDPKDADIWYFMGTSHTMSAGKLSSL